MKVNIGGQKGRKRGPFRKWTVIDTRKGADIEIDLMSKPIPLKTQTIDCIYTSHTLEHILPDKIDQVFSECHRILKPGNSIRIVVPDIELAIQAYVNGDLAYLHSKDNPCKNAALPDLPICYLTSWFFTYRLEPGQFLGGHVMSFDFDLLKHYLEKHKFKNIRKLSYNKCLPVFNGCDFERYQNCSIYCEADKA